METGLSDVYSAPESTSGLEWTGSASCEESEELGALLDFQRRGEEEESAGVRDTVTIMFGCFSRWYVLYGHVTQRQQLCQ
jgi:hypothetical protein